MLNGSQKHKLDCSCCFCKSKRGETKGSGNGFYKKKHSMESKIKMEESHNDFFGDKNPFYGRKHTLKTKKRISICNGGDGNLYKNAEYPPGFNEKLKGQIRERDNYTCVCGITEEEHIIIYGKKLEVHHIDYDRGNCNKDNLITLCKQCNNRANLNRKYWEKYYNNKLKLI